MKNSAENRSYRESSCGSLRMLRSWIPVYRWAALASWFTIVLLVVLVAASAQNVVSSYPCTATLEPITISDEDLQRVVEQVPARRRDGAEDSPRLRKQLENHVGQLVEAFPYQAFQHTLGISNYEVCFNHPDELFYALSIALPYLSPTLADETKALLKRELEQRPPYSIDGYRNETGTNRTSYALPDSVRIRGHGKARDALGIYSLWAYCYYGDDTQAAQRTWPKVKDRTGPLVNQPYAFDIFRKDYAHDEAEHLNADLAGLIGYVRLARLVGDETALESGLARCRELLERRINLERVNPAFVAS